MREVEYIDARGRHYKVLLPDEVSDAEAPQGIPVGPPDVVDEAGIPEPQATRVHNELFARGIFTAANARRHPAELQAALLAALKVDATMLYQAFAALEDAVRDVRKSEVNHE